MGEVKLFGGVGDVAAPGSLGGQATNSNVASYCGFYTRGENAMQIVKGIGEEVLEKLREVGVHTVVKHSPTGNTIITFDEEELKYALDCLVQEYGLDVLLHCRMISAKKNEAGDKIESICCVDDENEYCFEAAQFVDASGDANLGLRDTRHILGEYDERLLQHGDDDRCVCCCDSYLHGFGR